MIENHMVFINKNRTYILNIYLVYTSLIKRTLGFSQVMKFFATSNFWVRHWLVTFINGQKKKSVGLVYVLSVTLFKSQNVKYHLQLSSFCHSVLFFKFNPCWFHRIIKTYLFAQNINWYISGHSGLSGL